MFLAMTNGKGVALLKFTYLIFNPAILIALDKQHHLIKKPLSKRKKYFRNQKHGKRKACQLQQIVSLLFGR